MKPNGICFYCGRRLRNPFGRQVAGVSRTVDGNPVRLHKACAKSFDVDQRREVKAVSTFRDRSFLGETIE